MEARSRTVALALVLSLVVGGCSKQSEPPLIRYSEPASASLTGNKALEDLSTSTRSKCKEYLKRVSFTPGMRREIVNRLSPELARLGAMKSVGAVGVPDPDSANGWRLLGYALIWRTDEAMRASDFGAAAQAFLSAQKLGWALVGGPAIEASLGYSIIADSRDVICGGLDRLGSAQLRDLSLGLTAVFRSRPATGHTFEVEEGRVLEATDAIQDAMASNRYDGLATLLGPNFAQGVKSVKAISSESSETINAFFSGLAEEAKRVFAELATRAAQPLAERSQTSLEPPKSAPWKTLAVHLFGGLPSLLAIADLNLARTRLMILHCQALSQAKGKRAAPKDLRAIPEEIKSDPYTGGELVYVTDGFDFKLYSVGTDLRDDGGRTDAEGLSPDIILTSLNPPSLP